MLIAAVLSLLLSRRAARMGLLVFALGYSALTAIVWYSTFSGEHDAQYQLALLVIPMIGFPCVAVVGLAALTSLFVSN